MDGLLLQTIEGLGDAPAGAEIWQWLQSEKEAVASEILSEGPLCHDPVSGMLEFEASDESGNEIEWRFRSQLETRLREINEAQSRLMGGAYGRCRDCGAEIDKRRLVADSAAVLCVSCQRSVEAEVAYCTL